MSGRPPSTVHRLPSTVHRPSSGYWLRAGFLSLMEKGAAMAFSLGTAVLLLRGLTKADFAAWGVFVIIGYFVEMGRSGLIQNGLVRHLAVNRHDREACAAISTASFALNVSFSLFSSLLIWFGADWIAQLYQVPQIRALLPAWFAINMFMAPYTHCYFVQQANFEFRGVFWGAVFLRSVPFAWALFCLATGKPVELPSLALAMLAGTAGGSMAVWLFARPFLHHARRIDLQWVARLASFGKYVLGTNLSTMFYKNIDKLALGHLLGPAAFAVYDAAGKVTQMVEMPAFSLAQAVFPKSAGSLERDGADGVKKLYERSVAATLAVILPFVVLVVLLAGPIIWLFAGEQYVESANVLRLTAFFGVFLPFAVQFGTVLDSNGRPATNFRYTFFTALLNLALSYWFVAQYGLFGAAFATLLGYAVSFALMQMYLFKHFKINALNAFRYLPEFYVTGWGLLKQRIKSKTAPTSPCPPPKGDRLRS